MTRDQLHKFLEMKSLAWMPTGSRVICDPPPLDTDEDYIVWAVDGIERALERAGFVMGTDPDQYEEMPDFWAYRLGEFNLVITYSGDFYKRFCDATQQAKALNLMDKADRIALFQKVLYGDQTTEILFDGTLQ